MELVFKHYYLCTDHYLYFCQTRTRRSVEVYRGQSPSGRPGSGSKNFGQDELQLEVKFNSNLIIKKILGKRCIRRSSTDTDQQKRRNSYFQMQTKKLFLENIKNVIKMRVRVRKRFDPTSSNRDRNLDPPLEPVGSIFFGPGPYKSKILDPAPIGSRSRST